MKSPKYVTKETFYKTFHNKFNNNITQCNPLHFLSYVKHSGDPRINKIHEAFFSKFHIDLYNKYQKELNSIKNNLISDLTNEENIITIESQFDDILNSFDQHDFETTDDNINDMLEGIHIITFNSSVSSNHDDYRLRLYKIRNVIVCKGKMKKNKHGNLMWPVNIIVHEDNLKKTVEHAKELVPARFFNNHEIYKVV